MSTPYIESPLFGGYVGGLVALVGAVLSEALWGVVRRSRRAAAAAEPPCHKGTAVPDDERTTTPTHRKDLIHSLDTARDSCIVGVNNFKREKRFPARDTGVDTGRG